MLPKIIKICLFVVTLYFYDFNLSNEFNVSVNGYPSPTSIKFYHRRRDTSTGELVVRGRLEILQEYIKENGSMTYDEFNKLLQCAQSEPSLEKRNIYDSTNNNKESLRLAAIYLETECLSLSDCINQINKYDNGNIPDTLRGKTNSPYQVRLIRVINNKVYYDWPWKRNRFDNLDKTKFDFLIKLSNVINNLPNLTYFEGEIFVSIDPNFMNTNFPFPSLSNPSPNNKISFLKPDGLLQENYRYNLAYTPTYDDIIRNDYYIHTYNSTCPLISTSVTIKYNNNITIALQKYNLTSCSFSDYIYNKYHSNNLSQYKKRNNKLGYVSDINIYNHIVYNLSINYPDLIDAKWIDGIKDIYPDFYSEINNNNSFYQNLLKLYKKNDFNVLYKYKYKYILVMVGKYGQTSDKLANILAHSGAVTLLQTNYIVYHFSDRIKPWIHYVPIKNNFSDLIDKIIWLNKHPIAAYRIASNAKAFGESFLRLEDYYCYIARFYMTLGMILNGSNALDPFDPYPLSTDLNANLSIDKNSTTFLNIWIFLFVLLILVLFGLIVTMILQ